MASSSSSQEIPTWSGDPVEFETFAIACRWYEKSVKESERKQSASRVWAKLTGPAKAVVRHLNPDDFETADGLTKLVEILRTSPLQQLPVPDLFKRLDAWHYIRRNAGESIPQLLVREEDQFTQLLSALARAREDRQGRSDASRSPEAVTPAVSASQSPTTGGPGRGGQGTGAGVSQAAAAGAAAGMTSVAGNLMKDFFEDELRGYRLLKSANLTSHERQNVLVQTQNSTSFLIIRRALRTLYADGDEAQHVWRKPRVWWNDYGNEWEDDGYGWDFNDPGNAAWYAEDSYYGPEWQYEAWDDSWNEEQWNEEDDPQPTDSNDPEEQQFKEAFALASEANRTLTEAREAVRLARQARGYFAPESNTGKGMSPSSSPQRAAYVQGKGKNQKGKVGGSKGKSLGPCFTCGQHGHSYVNCPDRHSKGMGKYGSKGFAKGKKGKPKGFQGSVQFYDLSSWQSPAEILLANVDRGNRVIVDSGASENAVGIQSLQKLVEDSGISYKIEVNDRPVFKFGNGQQLQAVSRADLLNTSLGNISFYVLGGEALNTPPLMGGKTLRALGAMLAYQNDLFIYKRQDSQNSSSQWVAVQMQSHPSHHVSIDVMEDAVPMDSQHTWFSSTVGSADEKAKLDEGSREVFMFHRMPNMSTAVTIHGNSNSLAQRLTALRNQIHDVQASMCRGRSQTERISLQRQSCAEVAPEPTCIVELLHQVRTEAELCAEEEHGRPVSPHGPTPQSDTIGLGGDCKDDTSSSGERTHGHREADGTQGCAAPEGVDGDPSDQHEVQGVLGAHGNEQPGERCSPLQDQGLHGLKDLGGDPVERHQGICGDPWIGSTRSERAGTDSSCRGIQSGIEGGSKDKDQEGTSGYGNRLGNSLGDDHFRRGGGCGVGSVQDQGRLNALWSSLKSLRQRIGGSKVPEESMVEVGDGICDCHGRKKMFPDRAIQFQGEDPSLNSKYNEGKTSLESCPTASNSIEANLPRSGPGGGKRHGVPPFTARKLAANVAVLGAMMLTPLREVLHQVEGSLDFLEVACSQTSSLSTQMQEMGYTIQRINVKEGYDLEKKSGTQKLDQLIREKKPKHTWISLPCTRLTSLSNLTRRDTIEEAAFQKRRGRDLQRAYEIACSSERILEEGDDLSWEWPTHAKSGWTSRAISKLCKLAEKHHRKIFWCHFHGCAYGLTYNSYPVQKSWTVATTDRNVWLALQKKCPGHTEHLHCRGVVAQASAYYPVQMVRAVCRAIDASWHHLEERSGTSLGRDVEHYLLDFVDAVDETYGINGRAVDAADTVQHQDDLMAREDDPTVLALTRQRMPPVMSKGKALENVKAMMMRVHKASGHASFANLQRLLRVRGAPPWAVALAGQLKCPECAESKAPMSAAVASLQETPGLFEIVGSDVFEYEYGGHKYKFLLMRDRASSLVQTELLQQYGGVDQPSAWEPTSDIIIRMFGRWMMNNPAPKWLLTDSATYFTSQAIVDFCMESGLGLLTTPAESHEMLGAEECAINLLKRTAEKLLRDNEELSVELAFHLASHGHNQAIGPSGYSPFRWTRGSSSPMENIPVGINPKKAFDGMLKLKERARVAFQVESAKARLSKLGNTTPKPVQVFKPGQLVMLWRQRMKPGKTGGKWVGPVRFLLQEGQTLWLATGATLIRARTNQVRSCTSREELVSTLEGTAILKMPVTLESLLRGFTGRHFSDVTGEVPSQVQRQADVQGAEVRQEPAVSVRPDTWRFQQDEGRRWLVRVHNLPRLSLFTPSRTTTLPIDEGDLSGRRKTKVCDVHDGSFRAEIEDDFLESEDPARALQDRWLGETWLELKTAAKQYPDASKSRRTSKPSHKRKAESELETIEEEDQIPDDSGAAASSSTETILPQLPVISPLTTALRAVGADAVDGVKPTGKLLNKCSHDVCVLPGGHTGPHEDAEGKQYHWNDQTGRVNVFDDEDSVSSSSTSSDSSEELVPDKPADEDVAQNLYVHKNDKFRKNAKAQKNVSVKKNVTTSEVFYSDTPVYALEIPFEKEDAMYLSKHPEKSPIWMSRKMAEKSKEKRWSQLTMEEKRSFDLAQAKELSNVLGSRALRALTTQELFELDPSKVASMRWVLTVKADGSSKARLVVLGFQMPGIENLQTSSPTMARLSRSLLLTIVANKGFRLRAGDVTSAFLQAEENLEHLNMTVWAPAELAVLFGADPAWPIMPLRVSKAFYGLVQAPRCWFDDVSKTMQKHGWKVILADRCVFCLFDDDSHELIAIAGLHVDDFLIGGDLEHPKYLAARKALEESYRWGKWQETEITFAGCKITQMSDGSLRIDQGDYVQKWLEEIQLPKHRMQQTKSSLTPSEISMLRGAIGTMAWKSSQTAPHHQADVGLLLSEIPMSTINTIVKTNKLIREIKREGPQSLLYPHWNRPWNEFAVISWCDAGQQNRPDHSSTLGVITGIAPREFLDGERCQIAIVNWRSSKTPRQCLGSNGAEVQAVTEGEDITFRVRAMWTELHGITLERHRLYDQIKEFTSGAIVMDTRGIFDAMSRNVSSLHGLRSSRAGYELTLAVQNALRISTRFRWVNGLAQLGDCLTKFGQKKMFLQFLSGNQFWRLVYDQTFTAGKKLNKRDLTKINSEMEQFFLNELKQLARAHRFPWADDDEVRSIRDESLADPFEHVTLKDMTSSPISHLS